MIHKCKCGGRLLRSDRIMIPSKESPVGYYIQDIDAKIAHFVCNGCGRRYQQRKRQKGGKAND
jgi:hypothetical protein